MNLSTDSPTTVAETLGGRLKRARLNANLTQVELAERTGLSRKAIINAEKGQLDLVALVAILQALDLVANLNAFLPEPEISPVQLARLKGKKRQRASPASAADEEAGEEGDLGW